MVEIDILHVIVWQDLSMKVSMHESEGNQAHNFHCRPTPAHSVLKETALVYVELCCDHEVNRIKLSELVHSLIPHGI